MGIQHLMTPILYRDRQKAILIIGSSNILRVKPAVRVLALGRHTATFAAPDCFMMSHAFPLSYSTVRRRELWLAVVPLLVRADFGSHE
jgi:hypothetical protein